MCVLDLNVWMSIVCSWEVTEFLLNHPSISNYDITMFMWCSVIRNVLSHLDFDCIEFNSTPLEGNWKYRPHAAHNCHKCHVLKFESTCYGSERCQLKSQTLIVLRKQCITLLKKKDLVHKLKIQRGLWIPTINILDPLNQPDVGGRGANTLEIPTGMHIYINPLSHNISNLQKDIHLCIFIAPKYILNPRGCTVYYV